MTSTTAALSVSTITKRARKLDSYPAHIVSRPTSLTLGEKFFGEHFFLFLFQVAFYNMNKWVDFSHFYMMLTVRNLLV